METTEKATVAIGTISKKQILDVWRDSSSVEEAAETLNVSPTDLKRFVTRTRNHGIRTKSGKIVKIDLPRRDGEGSGGGVEMTDDATNEYITSLEESEE